jgi:hypothetical protein
MFPTPDFSGWKSTSVSGALLLCVDREKQIKTIRLYNLNVSLTLQKIREILKFFVFRLELDHGNAARCDADIQISRADAVFSCD